MTKPLTPNQFWQLAATWGSFMTSGDPGACMYGFDERGTVQSEAHRQACIDYIETECRKAAAVNIAAGDNEAEQLGEIEAMLAYLRTAPVDGSDPKLDAFTEAYVTAALWSSTDDDDSPMDDNYSKDSIAPESLYQMIADCAHFQKLYGDLIVEENYVGRSESGVDAMAGHDFWLTRCGHGAGFWDGDWTCGDVLTKAAKSFGETSLYVGDDGRVYEEGGTTSPNPVDISSSLQGNRPEM